MSSELKIHRLYNNPISSNCYIIHRKESEDCVIIDPGSKECNGLINFLEDNGIKPSFIILTHEHFDHIWSTNKLVDLYDSKIICSSKCGEFITDRKKNLSVFFDQTGFENYPPDVYIEKNTKLKLLDIEFNFINTEGHTNGSICISVENFLFTGDTLMEKEKTVTKLPGGNKSKLLGSFNELMSLFQEKNPLTFPGHGESFHFTSRILNYLNNENSN